MSCLNNSPIIMFFKRLSVIKIGILVFIGILFFFGLVLRYTTRTLIVFEPSLVSNSTKKCLPAICDYNIQFNNRSNVVGFSFPVIPDIVHVLYMKQRQITFVQMVCIRSVLQNHNPHRLLLHCSECVDGKTMEGKYWNMLGEFKSRIEIVPIEEPKSIYGQKLTSVFHASDIARTKILMKHGGIYLDNDVYVVRSLHGFRHFEMCLGWENRGVMASQVVIAHKNARFLKLYLDSYHDYKGYLWYYNAGEYPTAEIIVKQPQLVHIVKHLFMAEFPFFDLYKKSNDDWMDYYTIHLGTRWLSDKNIKVFNESNIKTYPKQFGRMARYVLYGKTDPVNE
ncbi:hypothetical protein CHUAL_005325 [Chamberlinius hualienensis]